MVTVIECDGCGKRLDESRHQVAIYGERANGLGGGGMPDGEFHWCAGCGSAVFAFLASRAADIAAAVDRG